MSINPKRVIHERRLRDIAIKKRDRNLSAFKKQIRVLRQEMKDADIYPSNKFYEIMREQKNIPTLTQSFKQSQVWSITNE